MKCVILGGGGFIGSAITERLLRDGHQLRIFGRSRAEKLGDFLVDDRVEWVVGDFLCPRDVGAAIDGADVVVHLISSTLPRSSSIDPIFDVQSNVIGTLQLLNSMVERRVKKIIFISSGGTVYGRVAYLPVDEQHPTDPLVSYGIAKLAIEKYLAAYDYLHGIRSVALRVTNPFGERQRVETGQGAVGVFLHRALTGQAIDIWGDGSVVRDFIHVSDVAEAFALAVKYEGPHRIFNVSSGEGTSLNDLINIIGETLGIPLECRYQGGRSFDVPVSVLSNVLAQRELGWTPKLSLPEGIARTAEWMKKFL